MRCNERHDLVDLQILDQEESIDPVALAELAPRLFASRKTHEWPPTVVEYDGWDTIYAAAADGLDVISDVSDAVDWANELVARCADART